MFRPYVLKCKLNTCTLVWEAVVAFNEATKKLAGRSVVQGPRTSLPVQTVTLLI